MPRYKGQLMSEKDTGDDPILHLFEYCNGPQNNRTTYTKEIVALESCIFINRRTLAKRRRDKVEDQEEETRENQEKQKDSYPSLQVGQEFDGYIIKCPNGPYDYALKLWDTGRVAPWDSDYPREDEEISGVVIDRNGDYLTIACGSNIAYATKKSFMHAGVDPDDLSLPFGRLKVALTKAETRPSEVLVAAWVARPTQVAVPAHDVC